MNPLYQKMNNNNPLGMLNQIKSNPVGFLTQRGLNVPQGMNNPNDIIQHLMRTGQLSQERYNAAVNKAQMFNK